MIKRNFWQRFFQVSKKKSVLSVWKARVPSTLDMTRSSPCFVDPMLDRRVQDAVKALQVSSIRKPRSRINSQQWIHRVPLHIPNTVLTIALSNKMLHNTKSILPRPPFNYQRHICNISDALFARIDRLRKAQFFLLHSALYQTLKRGQRSDSAVAGAVSPAVMLFMTLPLLAGASYLDLYWPYDIAVSTVYRVFEGTLCALNRVLPGLHFPSTEKECLISARQFQQLRKSPFDGIIASLDGIAIEIHRPAISDAADPKKYYNRKGFFAIVVQAAVEANYKFSFISARQAGGTHDSTALAATWLYDLLKGDFLPIWATVVAEDAYPNDGRLLTPYSGKGLTGKQDAFNYYHSSCRVCAEQAFGMLVSCFGIYWSALRYPIANSILIIMVTVKLHNFIINNADGSLFDMIPTHELNSVRGSPMVHFKDMLHTERDNRRSRQWRRDTSVIRDSLAEQLCRLGFVRKRQNRHNM